MTYADDLVILCRKGKAEEALSRMREIMGKLKLTVNEEKTRICKVPEGEFDFLGYTFGRMYSKTTGKARLGMWPSKKSIRRMVEKVHDLTDLKTGWQETTEMVGEVESRAARLGELLPSRDRQPARTGRSTTTPHRGCAGGCATSTRSGDAGAGAIHSRTSTGTSGSCV